MKKLFIGVPMKGRSKEKIQASMDKMHKIAEAVFGEELEVIDSYIPDSDYAYNPIKCLGEGIKKMQDATYFIGTSKWDSKGCYIEKEVALSYMPMGNVYCIPESFILDPEELKTGPEDLKVDGEEAENVPIIS